MKTRRPRHRRVGFTLIELLCVISIIGILAALLLPALSQAKARTKRIACVSHLRQIGIAFHTFAHDHQGKFPMSVSTNQGGSLELVGVSTSSDLIANRAARHFATLASELVTPVVLVCPSDTRSPAPGFRLLDSTNVSYFASGTADPALPNSLLAGDRNLTNDYSPSIASVQFGPNHYLRWTRDLHQFKGNLLFADGRVEEKKGLNLQPEGSQPPRTVKLYLPERDLPAAMPVVPATKSATTATGGFGAGSGAAARRASEAILRRPDASTVQPPVVRSNSKPISSSGISQRPESKTNVSDAAILDPAAPAVANPADWVAGLGLFGLFVLLLLLVILAFEIRRRLRNRRLRRRLWR